MRSFLAVGVAALVSASAEPGAGGADGRIRADATFGPAVVRITVTLPNATIRRNDVNAVDAFPFGDGVVALRVERTRVPPTAGRLRLGALHVRVLSRGPDAVIVVGGPARRFKYVWHTGIDDRVELELWRAAPPSKRAQTPTGRGGCLTIDGTSVENGIVTAEGRERALFDHTFTLRVRGSNGRSIARRTVTARGGRWSAALRYRVSRPQPATLEAVDLAPADSSLTCLAQVRVRLD